MTGDAENRNENDSSACHSGLRAESGGKVRAGQWEAPRQRDDAVVNLVERRLVLAVGDGLGEAAPSE